MIENDSGSEAVVQRCSVKKGFLQILQNSQENTYARVSFLIKLQAWIKREALAQVLSCEFCKSFRNTFFIEHLWWLLLVVGVLLFTHDSAVKHIHFYSHFIKGTLMQIWKSCYVCIHVKTIPWNFRIQNSNNSRVLRSLNLQFSSKVDYFLTYSIVPLCL